MSNNISQFSYEGDFEAHITVNNSHNFLEVAKRLNIKPIQIELDSGRYSTQTMSSSNHRGTLQAVYHEVLCLTTQLKQHGFQVARVKIEASPFNKDIPLTTQEVVLHSPTNYFEHHVLLALPKDKSVEGLGKVCKDHNAHLSRNAFKKSSDEDHKFITVRNYGIGRAEAGHKFTQLLGALNPLGLRIVNQVTEYCVYDSNVDLDKEWIA